MELNKIYNMDCLDGLRQMEDCCVDLTVTSPPYDDLRKYNGYSWDFESIAKELYRVTKDGGVVVWVVGDKTKNGSETGTSFKQALFFKELGFNLHDTMIYQKSGSGACGSNKCYIQSFEYMFVFTKGKIKTYNLIYDRKNEKVLLNNVSNGNRNGDVKKVRMDCKPFGRRFNIWKYDTGNNKSTKDKIAFKHPAIFPEKLAYDHIISWSNEGDVVMDIFMGSGTTAKMCKLTNRNYIGFEISEEYCKIAEERLSKVVS